MSKKFVIVILIIISMLSACTEAQARKSPTATPTALPTPTRLPTLTPYPTVESAVQSKNGCALADLLPGQHISFSGSYTETQAEAAGSIVCRIEPNSCAYSLMVGNLDNSIVFKREEESPYDKEDILMHPAMLGPLSRLNELVIAEWGGAVQLRVTDAYDSLLEHDLGQVDLDRRASLHFEGRAIDLTTAPIDLSRYGRLCTLAHCAEFDWVYHEGDHCHAAVNAESLCLRCSGSE